MFTREGVPVAGAMPVSPAGPPGDVWTVYLAVADARATIDAAKEAGGTLGVAVMDIADLGSVAVLADPGGAHIGVWPPGTFSGPQVLAEAGTPAWFELHTRDYDAALGFYRSVFGWDTRTVGDTPELRYTTVADGEELLGGVYDAAGQLPEGTPGCWSVYFGVDDTRDAVARAAGLGGTVVAPARDTPYGCMAEVADPNGAHFKLIAPNDQMPAR